MIRTTSNLQEAQRLLCEALRDPNRVVLDANHAYEDPQGNVARWDTATRGCLITLAHQAADTAGVSRRFMFESLLPYFERSLIESLRTLGAPACADIIEAHTC